MANKNVKENKEVKVAEETKVNMEKENKKAVIFRGKELSADKTYEVNYKKPNKMGVTTRQVTTAFSIAPDNTKDVEFELEEVKYRLIEEKEGLKSICKLFKAGEVYLQNVTKKVVIDVLTEETTKSWNWIDNFLKGKLGLKTQGSGRNSKDKEVITIE